MRVTNNKILITGATSGIGESLLKKFLEHNNQVIALGRNKEKLDELSRLSNKVIPFPCDLSYANELDRLIVFLEQNHSDLNIIINNAGIQYNYLFAEEPLLFSKVEHELNVNLYAPFKIVALTLPLLMLNENAAIVNVSSGLALVPKMQAPVYCATKAAIHIFSKSLRYQLDDVKVFEIIPPLVDTEMTKGRGKGKISPEQLVDEFFKAFKRNRYEINIGVVKLLRIINRISPALADKIMKGGR